MHSVLSATKGRFCLSTLRTGLTSLLHRTSFHCLLIAALGFISRMPALQGLPLWDDEYLAGENPFIKSPLLFLEAFRHYLFPDGFSGHYRPMQNVSLGIDYLIWNNEAWGYHFTNLLLHIASGLLLYFLLRKIFAGEAPSCPQRL